MDGIAQKHGMYTIYICLYIYECFGCRDVDRLLSFYSCLSCRLYLGQVYRKTDRLERAKDCFIYALELERTQPIQPFSILPRCI